MDLTEELAAAMNKVFDESRAIPDLLIDFNSGIIYERNLETGQTVAYLIDDPELCRLARRISYGGRKGRRAVRRFHQFLWGRVH